MSFHPDSYDGFQEGEHCPYCDSMDIYTVGDSKREFGIMDFFLVTECECEECGKRFALVEVEYTEVYGTIPAESIYKGRSIKSQSTKAKSMVRKVAKPTVKKKAPAKRRF